MRELEISADEMRFVQLVIVAAAMLGLAVLTGVGGLVVYAFT